jgi:hypothetical protein
MLGVPSYEPFLIGETDRLYLASATLAVSLDGAPLARSRGTAG